MQKSVQCDLLDFRLAAQPRSPAAGGMVAAMLRDFRDPPAGFRLVPFWSWNEAMEPGEVRRQVALMKQGGWGGAFVHSRIGLVTPYLGEDWFRAVDATMEACKAEGLQVWLYDEDKWPSGYSGGTVPLADKRFRAKALIARPVGQATPSDCEPVGHPADGLQVFLWTAPLGDPWFNGTSAVDRGSRAAMRKFLDDAYESYYSRYEGDYGELIQAEFTDEPCMMFRIACPAGAVPHSETAFERFEEMHGCDPVPRLHLLFTEMEGAERFRLQWHRTINDLFETNYSRQLGEWCGERGIALTGHYMCEHGVYAQQNWGVKVMPNYRHQQIPGIDHLGRQISERITAKQCQSVVNQFGKKRMLSELYGVAGGGLSFEDRKWIALQQICLGVNLLNPHLSLYTMAGCRKRDYPQNIFYQQPWWELNRIVDDALARLCLIMSQGRYSPSILLLHPQESAQALWRTRTAGFDQDLTAPWSGQDWNPCTPESERRVRAIEKQFFACIDALLGAQRSFDLGDEWILRDSGQVVVSERGAELQVGEMRYRLVVIPSMETMAPETFALLKEYRDAGGSVLAFGDVPGKIDGEPSAELVEWFKAQPVATENDFIAKAQELAPPTLRLADVRSGDRSLLWAHPRDLADGSRIILLVNLSRTESLCGELQAAGRWKQVCLLDESNGEIGAVDFATPDCEKVSVSVELAPCECRLFLLTKSEDRLAKVRPARRPGRPGESVENRLLQDWRVTRLDDNALTLDCAAWRETGAEWSAGAVPIIEISNSLNARKYDGPLALRYDFQMEGLGEERKLHLVVEHPERCRITLNGEQIRYEGLPAWRDIRWMPIDITGKVRSGANGVILEYADFRHGDPAIVAPAEARYGTEIESIYLVGDFSVAGETTGTAPLQPKFEQWQVPPVAVDTLKRCGMYLSEPQPLKIGDVTSQGLPFYAGRIAMECKLPAAQSAVSAVYLEIEQLLAPIAEVRVDGRTVGHFLAHPYRVDLSEALLDGLPHTLTILVYTTLRNLLGPHHHIDGELIEVGPGHFQSDHIAIQPDRHAALRAWAAGAWRPADWLEDYCLIQVGDLGFVRLVTATDLISKS